MNTWADGIRAEVKRAVEENTDEGRAAIILAALPQRCYEHKRRGETDVKVRKLYSEYKSIDDLTGVCKLVAMALIKEGFKLFIKEVLDDMDGGTMYNYFLCIQI